MNLFFDLDGTIVDVAARHYETYRRVVESAGGSALPSDVVWPAKRNGTRWGVVLERSGVELDEAEFVGRFAHIVEQRELLAIDSLLAPGCIEGLAAQFRVYVVTHRWHRHNLMEQLDQLGLRHHLADVISAPAKPGDSTAKARMIADLATAGDVMIGDTESDVLAAHELGIESVAVHSGLRDEHFLTALEPTWSIDDISLLPELLEAREAARRGCGS